MKKEKQNYIISLISNGILRANSNGDIIRTYTSGITKLVNGYVSSGGYKQYTITDNSKHYVLYVHTIVWLYFAGSIPDGMEINHINGIKTDNRIENLEMVTPSQNVKHAWSIGLHPSPCGENNPMSKLRNNQVIIIRKLLEDGNKIRAIARYYNVSDNTISDIKHNRHWKSIV